MGTPGEREEVRRLGFGGAGLRLRNDFSSSLPSFMASRSDPPRSAGGAGTGLRVPRVEATAEDPVGGGEEGDREVEGLVEDPGPSGGREVQTGGTRLPLQHGRGKTGAGRVEDDAVSAVSGLEVREWLEEQGAGAEEPGDGGEPPLFLPTPDFVASVGTMRNCFPFSFSFFCLSRSFDFPL